MEYRLFMTNYTSKWQAILLRLNCLPPHNKRQCLVRSSIASKEKIVEQYREFQCCSFENEQVKGNQVKILSDPVTVSTERDLREALN